MAVRKKKKAKPLFIAIILIACLLVFVLGIVGVWFFCTGPINKNDSRKIEVVIPSGASSRQIGIILKEKDLIKNDFCFRLYIKLHNVNSLKASTYLLSKDMSLKDIVTVLEKGNNYNPNVVRITFKEGWRITDYVKEIVDKTNNDYNDVKSVINDRTYLSYLINKYWFLTDDILQTGIYYPLEGYLAPDTYEFLNKDVSVKTIIETMLDETGRNLKKYKNSKKNVHYAMTMASIAEIEGNSLDNRKDIVGVFENRLNQGMNLGSDVTTYYALQLPLTSDLTSKQFNAVSPYNTRSKTMMGKMPIGPISNPSKVSIEAAFEPNKNNYFFFVADKHGKIYFTKTMSQHNAKVKEIKEKGDWIW